MLALIAAAALTAAAPAARLDPADTIVVTGVRMSDLKDAVDACATSGCTPRRDIVASIRYAEALFRSGDVRHARDVLTRAVSRTKGAGAKEPIALSQLYLARANVAGHWGDQREYAAAIYASAKTVRDNLPADSPDVLFAALLVADLHVHKAQFLDADAAYRLVATRARVSGQAAIAASADLRRAWLLELRGDHSGSQALLATLMAEPGNDARWVRVAARVVAARIARQHGDEGATTALLAALASEPQAEPLLVWAPPRPNPTDAVTPRNAFEFQRDTQTRSSDRIALSWADLGFWIAPDGKITDVEVLRGSRDPAWTAPLVATIAARRYTPFTDSPGSQGRYRVERYTWTADFVTPIGSNIRRRAGAARYEHIDLTEAPPKATADGSGR